MENTRIEWQNPLERCCGLFPIWWVVYHFSPFIFYVLFSTHPSIHPHLFRLCLYWIPVHILCWKIKSRFFYLIHAISLQTYIEWKAGDFHQRRRLSFSISEGSCHFHANRIDSTGCINLFVRTWYELSLYPVSREYHSFVTGFCIQEQLGTYWS